MAKFPGTIPINPANLPANLAAVYDSKDVSIKILADPSIWQKLSPEAFRANIDLTGLTAGTHQVSVNVVSSISGVQIVDKNPSTILVTLEPVVTKDVSVVERIDGQAADGMVPGDISFNPSKVQVTGAKSIVDGISEAVAVVSLKGESADFSQSVRPVIYDDENQQLVGVKIKPAETKAEVSIVRGSNTKTVGIKVQVIGTPRDNYYIANIASTPGAVDISGVRTTVLNTKFIETSPIDVTGATSDITKDVTLSVPDGLTILNSNSTKVHVAISIQTSVVSRAFDVTNFKSVSGNSTITSINPAAVTVICSGSVSTLNSISASDFTILFDLADKMPDSHGEIGLTLTPVNIQTPSGISVSSVVNPNVKVKVQ